MNNIISHLFPFGLDELVVLRRRRHRVVRVDDRHDVHADQLGQRAEQIFARLVVVKIGFGDQHLGDLDAVLREHGVVQRHEAGLADGRGRPGLEQQPHVLPGGVVRRQRLPHAQRHEQFLRQFLFTERHRSAGHHNTLAAVLVTLGHLIR